MLDEGKTGKYLKYAIGEIVLVVIGILIALQINSWNDERKAKIVENNFFDNVLLDLEKDNENLNYYNRFHQKRIQYLDTLLTYVRNPNRTMGIEKFGMYVEPLFYSVNATNYLTTFENSFSSITRLVENQFEPLMYTLPEGYMTETTGNLVINEEDVQIFYNKVSSIKDNRNIIYDYDRILKTSSFENYLIGDMGRSYGAIAKIESRKAILNRLLERIREHK